MADEGRVYQWQFADRQTPVLGVAMPITPDPGFELGAAHSSELNVFFPNFSNTDAISGPDLSAASPTMGDRLIAAWAVFIRRGDPAAEWIPEWKPYGEAATAIRFEPGRVREFDPWSEHKCSFWRSHYPNCFAN